VQAEIGWLVEKMITLRRQEGIDMQIKFLVKGKNS